jgi:hypothetical protein
MQRRWVAGLATVAALAVSPRALALTTGLCTTGPYAVSCDWCPAGSSCASGKAVGTTSNGRVQHPELVMLFWQDKNNQGYQWETWSRFANTPTQSQLVGAALGLVNSPYYASLWQYGGLYARPRLSPYATLVTGPPDLSPSSTTTASFQDTDLEYLINQQIAAGLVPPPAQGDDVLYVVILPETSPGTSTGSNASCYHDHSGCNYSWGSYQGTPYTFAYVVADASASATFARETVNAITGFEDVRVDGCTYVHGGGRADQVADLCQCATEQWASGLALQAYWSVADGACVVPESWGPLMFHTSSDSEVWVDTTVVPRQAYGGGDGVVYTDTRDEVWFFDSDDGSATALGGQGAELAVGPASDDSNGKVIAALALDTQDGVRYFNTGTKTWYSIGAPAGPLTSLTVTGQGIIVATDTFAQPWYYIPANRPHAKWTKFGTPGDQVIAIADDVYALGPARDSVLVWPWQDFGLDGLWSQVRSGTSYMQIVGSPDSEYWATSEPGDPSYWPSGSYLGVFVDAYDFAVSGNPLATYVAGGLDVQGQALGGGTGWNVIGPQPVGRLVSGNKVYATSCPGSYPCVVLVTE